MSNASGAGSDAARVDVGGWTLLSEQLLRGFVHALNNRVTSMSAVAELADLDDEPLMPKVVREELGRIVAIARMVGSISVRGGEAEALELRAVLEEALRLHAHHPRLRVVACSVEASAPVLPVRTPRWALLRLLLLMVDQVKHAWPEEAGPLTLALEGDAEMVRLRCPAAEAPHHDAVSLAELCGGTLELRGPAIVLELPSLAEVRRRSALRD